VTVPPRDPELEQELERVVIGERQPGPVELVEYDPRWPQRFELVRGELAGCLGVLAIAIEHIGSTAVPGLAAKPIVDVLVTVAGVEPEDSYAPAIVALGYELRVREPGHRMFRPPAHDVHIHVWAAGAQEVADYLLLRDRLRASAADREAYAALKRDLAGRDWPDLNYYARAKGPLIAEIIARAH
jgi:GrpB-like predicted nucleotidyltransferase (UPF0157 family)